jgi:hypothetical protein
MEHLWVIGHEESEPGSLPHASGPKFLFQIKLQRPEMLRYNDSPPSCLADTPYNLVIATLDALNRYG